MLVASFLFYYFVFLRGEKKHKSGAQMLPHCFSADEALQSSRVSGQRLEGPQRHGPARGREAGRKERKNLNKVSNGPAGPLHMSTLHS